MIIHSAIDPVAFTVFGKAVHWYGMMYLFGFLLAWGGGLWLLRQPVFAAARNIIIEDFIVFAVLGVIVGGRLGYVLFYNLPHYLENPLEIPRVWDGGMSFHGGLIGVIFFIALYAKIRRVSFWRMADFAAVLTPPGLGLGRIGNFINGELPGRLADADLPWAMVFPLVDEHTRHPSQLYQAFLEGVLLTALMLFLARRPRLPGGLAAAFLSGYAVARFAAEFFREPDFHIGLLWLDLSLGQWLTIPMFIFGAALLYSRRQKWRRRPGAGLIKSAAQKWQTIKSATATVDKTDWDDSAATADADSAARQHPKISDRKKVFDFLSAQPDDGWEADEVRTAAAIAVNYHSPSRIVSWLSAAFSSGDDEGGDNSSSNRRIKRRQKKRKKR